MTAVARLLDEAVRASGKLGVAYTVSWNYSSGDVEDEPAEELVHANSPEEAVRAALSRCRDEFADLRLTLHPVRVHTRAWWGVTFPGSTASALDGEGVLVDNTETSFWSDVAVERVDS